MTDPVALTEAQARVRQDLPEPQTSDLAPDPAPDAAPDGAVQSPGELDGWTVRDPHSDARYAVDGDGALLRDIHGARIAIDLKPGDPSPKAVDVETASQSVDLVKDLQSTERFSQQQVQEAMAKADRLYRKGSAMAEAAKAYVMERSSALGENPETAQAALDRLNQLARDPKTFAGMRENRAAYEAISAGDRAAAKTARFEIERARRAGMKTAVSAYRRLHGATGGQMKRGLARTEAERRVAFDRTVKELAARQTALAEREAALPGVPHPDLDPGLAGELGQDAAQVLDGYDKAKSVALDVGFTVAAALLPITAPAAALRAGATKEGAKRIARSLGMAADGADAVMAAQQAADEGVRVELDKLGLDPSDPEALSRLPPEAVERIRTRTAIAAAASVGSNKAASDLVDRATKNAGLSELEKAAAEEGVSRKIQEIFEEEPTIRGE